MVEHQLTISVAGNPRYLLGSKSQIMVIAPGQSVKQIRIKEANTHEQD